MKRLIACIILLSCLTSCAYYGETILKVKAKKAQSIAPQVPIGVDDPDCWLIRRTSFSLWKDVPDESR